MSRPKGWGSTMTSRSPMRSPGYPGVSRDIQRLFWARIAEGLSSEDAAVACEVSPAVGARLFRQSGSMPQITLTVSGRYLSFAEQEDITLMRAQDVGVREIARRLGRSASTVSRELRRNAATRGGTLQYRASTAQWKAERSARRPKPDKLISNPRLHDYVQQRLSDEIIDEDGNVVGPEVEAFKGRRHGPRKDRLWAASWSPEQISGRLVIDFPDDEEMRISHEAIYQALYIQGRGALKRELVGCLRTGRALRIPRERARLSGRKFVGDEVRISERPAEADDRVVPGHWEGDLILGTGSSAIGTLVERTTRLTILLRLPRIPEHGRQPKTKNCPPLAGHGAVAVNESIAKHIGSLPKQLRKSLDLGPGRRNGLPCGFEASDRPSPVYFYDPKSP